MINVPTTVKDALKDGSLLKNYRFKVQRKTTTRNSIIPIGILDDSNRQFTIPDTVANGYYLYMDAAQPTCTLGGRVNFPPPNSGYMPFTIEHTNGTETLALLRGTAPGGVIDITNALIVPTFPTIQVTTGDLITYTDRYYDDFVIDNDTIIKESVKIDERMASGETLKFGLAEGSSLEFQYFDHPNIRGRRINAELEVQYDLGTEDYVSVHDFFHDGFNFRVTHDGLYQIRALRSSSGDLTIRYTVKTPDSTISDYRLNNNTMRREHTLPKGSIVTLYNYQNQAGCRMYWYTRFNWDVIPMGSFDVAQCPVQLSTGIRKVTAYNRLTSEILNAPVGPLINNAQSDNADSEKITIQTIQSLLLNDFRINESIPGSVVTQDGVNEQTANTGVAYKLRGSSTTRYLCVSYRRIFASTPVNRRIKLDINKYIAKAGQQWDELKNAIYTNVQNPDTVWNNLKNSGQYQLWFNVACIFGSGSVVNGAYFFEKPTQIQSNITTIGDARLLKYLYGISKIDFNMPTYLFGAANSSSTTISGDYIWNNPINLVASDAVMTALVTDDIETITISKSILSKNQVTLRDIINANYELHCQYGHIDRETNNFSAVELATDTAEDVTIDSCSKLWTDTSGEHSFRNLIVTYKTLNDQNTEEDEVMTITVNSDGTTDYIMDDNWLLRNMVWDYSDVYTLVSEMADKMTSIRWTPYEMWCAGLPYLETGDKLQITDNSETFTSYILQRQLKGVHNLQDTYINGTLDVF